MLFKVTASLCGFGKCLQSGIFQRRLLNSAARESIRNSIDAGFDNKQTEVLLKTLNTMTAEDYANTDLVSISKAISICRWRDSLGGFNKVSDILKITGVGNSLAEKLCRKLLGEDVDDDDGDVQLGKPGIQINGASVSGCIPRLSTERALSISSFASLDIGQNQVTWCSMSRDLTKPESALYVSDWNRTQFLETPFLATKHSHATLHEKMIDVVYKQLPRDVDCYITEFKRLRCPSLKFMPLIVNQTIAETVLLTLLNAQTYNCEMQLHRVFKLRPSVVTRLFGLSVGNERVSGHRIVESAIEKRPSGVFSGQASELAKSSTGQDNFSVDLSPVALSRYRQVGEIERESFNIAFLLGVAFYELVLKGAEKIPNSVEANTVTGQ